MRWWTWTLNVMCGWCRVSGPPGSLSYGHHLPTQAPTHSHSRCLSQGLGSQHQGTPVFWEWRPLPRDPWPQTPVVRAGQVEVSKHSPRPGGRRVDGEGARHPRVYQCEVPPHPPETWSPSPTARARAPDLTSRNASKRALLRRGTLIPAPKASPSGTRADVAVPARLRPMPSLL